MELKNKTWDLWGDGKNFPTDDLTNINSAGAMVMPVLLFDWELFLTLEWRIIISR